MISGWFSHPVLNLSLLVRCLSKAFAEVRDVMLSIRERLSKIDASKHHPRLCARSYSLVIQTYHRIPPDDQRCHPCRVSHPVM